MYQMILYQNTKKMSKLKGLSVKLNNGVQKE
jgi:hypothetical protein